MCVLYPAFSFWELYARLQVHVCIVWFSNRLAIVYLIELRSMLDTRKKCKEERILMESIFRDNFLRESAIFAEKSFARVGIPEITMKPKRPDPTVHRKTAENRKDLHSNAVTETIRASNWSGSGNRMATVSNGRHRV